MESAFLRQGFEGDIYDDMETRRQYRRDTSIFERIPDIVAFPRHAADVATLVKAVKRRKEAGEDVSITARSAGTCMSGGSLTRSVSLVYTKYMNSVRIEGMYGYTEPGALYRDFEKESMKHHLLLPSYPASRLIAGMGGIIANNSGGERSLEYGKTEKYVEELSCVLSDGTHAVFTELTEAECEEKKKLSTLEGAIYRQMSALLDEHEALIEHARPRVSKNSAGYALWNIKNKEKKTFNLAKLIVGSQGTLALITRAKLRLIHPQPYRSMVVVFLKDIEHLPEIVKRVLPFNPESFESYDEHTFSLAIRYLPQMLSQMGFINALKLGWSFIPELILTARGGIPNMLLMAEFSEDTQEAALAVATQAQRALSDLSVYTRIAKDESAAKKYWLVRRESFALLRKNLKGLYASAFIDDFVVPPERYSEFLPRLNALLKEYNLIYTIAGHIGNGNFHIIPLMDLNKESERNSILELAPKVYDLVIEYGGTTTGEHNDGIIRTPYLTQLFGKEMVALFEETKRIFDPLNIFNPGKKVGGTFDDIRRDIITSR